MKKPVRLMLSEPSSKRRPQRWAKNPGWINPTHIARQNGSLIAALETHLENSFCEDGFPARRWMKKAIPWRIG
jgi:hypothetical protein